MSMYGKYKKGDKAWPVTDFSEDKGRTVQYERDDADINKIIARFEKSGVLPPMLRGEPFYGDVSEFGGLAESMMKIQEADDLFMSFPANIRERFDNDKAKFVSFLADQGNREEAIELGLIQKAPNGPEAPTVKVP